MKIKTANGLSQYFQEIERENLDNFFKSFTGEMRSIGIKQIQKILKPRPVFAHKGNFGHALMIAGYEGTLGAGLLASKAALKSGCGLLTALIPNEAKSPLLVQLPEAMTISRDNLSGFFSNLHSYNAIGFGPGAGTGEESAYILHHLLNNYKGPLVIDADGLTLLSKNKSWFSLLGKNIILTPHPGEFDRMTTSHHSALQRLEKQISFAKEYKTNIVLKGHFSSLVINGEVHFNSTGNSGMATAGSGDVLTGILTSLCAQGYEAGLAAKLGIFLHGFAGDSAAKKHSMHSMIASDIVNEIGTFFKKFERLAH